jgi:hypothetical protein
MDQTREPRHIGAGSRSGAGRQDSKISGRTPLAYRDTSKKSERRWTGRHPDLIPEQLGVHPVGIAFHKCGTFVSFECVYQRGATHGQCAPHQGVGCEGEPPLFVRQFAVYLHWQKWGASQEKIQRLIKRLFGSRWLLSDRCGCGFGHGIHESTLLRK